MVPILIIICLIGVCRGCVVNHAWLSWSYAKHVNMSTPDTFSLFDKRRDAFDLG